jgi:hypothetical protein
MFTVCGEEYVPVIGEISGVDVGDGMLMVITEVAVELCEKLGALAIAFTAVVLLTVNAPLYGVEDVVGWLPSSV